MDGQHIVLSLWDTAGQEEFDRLRTLSYADTHVIMLCFSVESRDSLENVQDKWWDEIARHCEGTTSLPILLGLVTNWSRGEVGLGGVEV